jgi:RNA polymerase sigma-70 factor, ECF subfamily
MPECDSDQALLEAAIAGDVAALERLLLTHYSALDNYVGPQIPPPARRYFGAEDVLQEVFSQAFRDIGKFTPKPDGSFYAWLKAIADHRLADALKRMGRKKRGGEHNRLSAADMVKDSAVATLVDLVGCDSHLPDDSVARHEAAKAVRIALAGLPDHQREAIQANILEGKSIENVAQEMGRTTGAVRGLIDRGKKKLAEAMGRSSRWLSSR